MPGASDAGDFDRDQCAHESYAFVKSFARFGARPTRADAMMSRQNAAFENPWWRRPF